MGSWDSVLLVQRAQVVPAGSYTPTAPAGDLSETGRF
jgi:hypothetical protein